MAVVIKTTGAHQSDTILVLNILCFNMAAKDNVKSRAEVQASGN